MDRKEVFDKYNGKCAYTGKDLGEDWQIDHVESKSNIRYSRNKDIAELVRSAENLLPALRIVNHYKREKNLEQFRVYMMDFHKRLAKLPKQTKRPQTIKRIEYMNKIAEAFDITVDKSFLGKFYFEIIGTESKG